MINCSFDVFAESLKQMYILHEFRIFQITKLKVEFTSYLKECIQVTKHVDKDSF
jgi:hypothetical protein